MKKLALILGAAVILGGCNRLENHEPLDVHSLSFATSTTIAQTFPVGKPNFNRVDICVRNTDRVLLPLRFSVYEGNAVTPIRKIDFSGGNIDNQDCTRFQFLPIENSAGKTYRAEISLLPDPDVLPGDYATMRESLFIEANNGGDFPQGAAYTDGAITPYDLHFKSYYQEPLKAVWDESVSQLMHRLTLDPFFFGMYLLGVGATLVLLVKKQ